MWLASCGKTVSVLAPQNVSLAGQSIASFAVGAPDVVPGAIIPANTTLVGISSAEAIGSPTASWAPTLAFFDPQPQNVKLLLHAEGTPGSQTYTDSSIYNRTLTGSSNAVLSTAQVYQGSTSLNFTGAVNLLAPVDSPANPNEWERLGSELFPVTLEAAFYQVADSPGGALIAPPMLGGTSFPWLGILLTNMHTPAAAVEIRYNGFSTFVPFLSQPSQDAFHVVAVEVTGTTFGAPSGFTRHKIQVWLDGVWQGEAFADGTITSHAFTIGEIGSLDNQLDIGRRAGNDQFLGFLDELRVSEESFLPAGQDYLVHTTDLPNPILTSGAWDPAYAGAPLVLSGNNLTVTLPTGNSAVLKTARTDKPITSGKWYWEVSAIDVYSASGSGSTTGVGIVGPTHPSLTANIYISSALENFGWWNSGDITLNGSVIGFPFAGYNDGDTLMFALDADAGKVWIGLNGTWYLDGPYTPTSGFFTLGFSSYYIATTPQTSLDQTVSIRLNAKPSFPIPPGFNYYIQSSYGISSIAVPFDGGVGSPTLASTPIEIVAAAISSQEAVGSPTISAASTSPNPNFANVKLLLHMQGTVGTSTITDSSSFARTVSFLPDSSVANRFTISSTTSLFGGQSLDSKNSFGTGAQPDARAAFTFPAITSTTEWSEMGTATAPLTLEMGVMFPTTLYNVDTCSTTSNPRGSGQVTLARASGTQGWKIQMSFLNFAASGANPRVVVQGNFGESTFLTLPVTISDNTWYRIAIEMHTNGGFREYGVWIDGVWAGSVLTSFVPVTTGGGTIMFGDDEPSGGIWNFKGYMDEVRVSEEAFLPWGSNYTLHTGPFPDS